MPTSVGYAYEKLSNAVEYLATGAGDVRDRLRMAGREVLFIRTEELPEWLQSEVNEIITSLTKRGCREGFDSPLESTLHGMHRSTGVAIARRIYELKYRVQSSRDPSYDAEAG